MSTSIASRAINLTLNLPQWKHYRWIGARRKVFLPWGRGTGKALALDTPLPTPGGWTTMGEVQAGDVLFDERGEPCTVTATTPVMHDHPCFAVVFDDGEEIIADAEHLWFTWDKRARKSHGEHLWFTWDKRARKSHGRQGPGRVPTCHPAVRTTLEIRNTLKASNGRETNHSIPLAAPLNCPDDRLPIDPYVLGVWLGDGTSTTGAVTLGPEDDQAIAQLLQARGCLVGEPRVYCERAPVRTLGLSSGPLTTALRAAGLLNNKHIPAEYLRASVEQREWLLKGLLDTDGYCDDSRVEFTSTNYRLATDTLELAKTLGHKATLLVGRATLNGVDCGPKYRVCFTAHSPVFGLARKNAPIRSDRAQRNRTSHRYIVDVRAVQSVPVRCIQVDSPSRLYLAGHSMVPTHNTAMIRIVLLTLIAEYDGMVRTGGIKTQRGLRVVFLMPTLKQFKDVYWADLEADLKPGGAWDFLGARLDKGRGHIVFPGGSWIKPFPASQGGHAKRALGMRADVLVGDEIDDIEAHVYDGVGIPLLSDPVSLGLELLAGVPNRGRHGLWFRLLETCRLADRLRRGLVTDEQAMLTDAAKATLEVFEQLDPQDWPEGYSTDPVQATLQVLRSYYGEHATYRDVPDTVSPLAIARARAEMTPAAFKREYEADPNAGEGMVFPFDEDFHVRAAPPITAFDELHVGMDHGTSDPGAMVLCGIMGKGADRTLWLLDEWYETGAIDDVWDQRAQQWNVGPFWVDRSRPNRIQKLIQLGIDARAGDSDPGAVETGIAAICNLMFKRKQEVGTPPFTRHVEYAHFYVDHRCVNTIRELGKYRYKRLPDGTFDRKPVGKDDHTIDCTRYVVLGVFGRPTGGRHVTSGR